MTRAGSAVVQPLYSEPFFQVEIGLMPTAVDTHGHSFLFPWSVWLSFLVVIQFTMISSLAVLVSDVELTATGGTQ